MNRLVSIILLTITFSSFSQTEKLKNLSFELYSQRPDTSKINSSIKIIKLLYESKDYSNALKYAHDSEELSLSINYLKGLAQINYVKGLIYVANNDVINALKHYKASKLLYEDLKSPIDAALVNRELAILEIKHANVTLGLKNALAAIAVFKEKERYDELIITYNAVITVLEFINENNKALVFCFKRLEILEALNDKKGQIKGNKKVALLYEKEDNYPKAINFLNITLGLDPNNITLKGDLFPILGRIYLNKGAYNTAMNYLKKGLEINQTNDNLKGVILCLSTLGDINIKKRDYGFAEKQFLKVQDLAHLTKDSLALINSYERLIMIDSIEGNYKRAFENRNAYFTLLNRYKKENQSSKHIETPLLHYHQFIDSVSSLTTKNSFSLNQEKVEVNRDQKLDYLRKILYPLLICLTILAIGLSLTYNKLNKNIKYVKDLQSKNNYMKLQKETLLDQNRYFENLSNSKDKLFSIVSHDLKDFLSASKGLIDLLREGNLSKEEFDSLIPELSETTNNASSLLFNLLNWSKSQMKMLKPNLIHFDIKEIVNHKVKLIEQKLIAKNITLTNQSDSNLVYADKNMIEIVIQNVIANAVKFCNSTDKITIANRIVNDHLLISIEDTGIGISKKNISKLFILDQNFTKIGTHNEKGTGLGLSICKDLITLNNGRIWAESELGIGSIFYIELPMSQLKLNEKQSLKKVAIPG